MPRIRLLAALALLATALVAVPTPVRAATTLFVDDEFGCDDVGGIPYYCTIQAAVVAAVDGDTIEIAAGTYTSSGSAIATIDKDLVITGAGIGLTVIDGQDLRRGLVFGSSADADLHDLTIRNGAATTGGGVLTSAGTLSIFNVAFEDNNTTEGGGAIFYTTSADVLEISGSIFDQNHDTGTIGVGGGGGAIGGPSPANTAITITDSTFTDNTAVAHGGAVKAFVTGGVIVTGSRFSGNSTSGGNGGAVALHASGGTFTISDSVFQSNSGAIGGAVVVADGAHSVIASYFTLNTASNFGGGIAQETVSDVAIVNSTFYDNEATVGDGGGAFLHQGLVLNSTFSHNQAGDEGGGLARGTTGAHAANSIFANNTAGSSPDCHNITSEGHNLIEDATGCVLDGDATGNVTGVDPLLFPPADNGGSTPTMRLPLSSPATNAGNPGTPGGPWVLDAGDWTCTPTDQRGDSREDGPCDIGAYEEGRVVRYSGPNRYATAAAISANDFPDPGDDSTVFIATGLGFADGLAASAIAPWFNAPLLLVNSSGIPGETAAELTRLNPDRIYLFGGSTIIPDSVKFALEGYAPVTRIAGNNRYATAIAISQLGYPGDNNAAAVFIATGLNFPDALAAAPAAYVSDGPVLLVPGSGDTLPAEVAAEILRLEPADIFVVGGTGAVSDAILQALEALQVGDTVTRVSGGNRYETSANLAAQVFDTGADRVYLATGLGFADTLAGGAAAGRYNSPILLVPGTSITGPVGAEITSQAPDFGVLLGGTAVVSAGVGGDLYEILVIV